MVLLCSYCDRKFKKIDTYRGHLQIHLKRNFDFIEVLNLARKAPCPPENLNFELMLNNIWADNDNIMKTLKQLDTF